MTDTAKTIKCPACGVEMQKIFITDKGINIDVCSNGCGGIFFDNKELQEFAGTSEDVSEIKQVLANKNFMPVDERKPRTCPACGTQMVKTQVFGIQIDSCYKCGGIFLDNGEFELVRSKIKKPKKVIPVKFDPNSDIDLQEFYREAQMEEMAEEYGRNKAAGLLFGRGLLGFLRFF